MKNIIQWKSENALLELYIMCDKYFITLIEKCVHTFGLLLKLTYSKRFNVIHNSSSMNNHPKIHI